MLISAGGGGGGGCGGSNQDFTVTILKIQRSVNTGEWWSSFHIPKIVHYLQNIQLCYVRDELHAFLCMQISESSSL